MKKLWMKMLAVCAVISTMATALLVNASAASTIPSELVDQFSDGVGNVGDSIFAFLGIALPVGIGVVAAVLAIKFGIRFVKGLIGRA